MSNDTIIEPAVKKAVDQLAIYGHWRVHPDSPGDWAELLAGTSQHAGAIYLKTGQTQTATVIVRLRRFLAGRAIDINLAYSVTKIEGRDQANVVLIAPKIGKLAKQMNWVLN